MNILTILEREHEIFDNLLKRIEKSVEYDEESTREEIRKVLLILLPALRKHEEFEDLIFLPHGKNATPAQVLAVDMIDAQHKNLAILREELEEFLDSLSACPLDTLIGLGLKFALRVRVHFKTEEKRLWPLYSKETGRTLDKIYGKSAQERLVALEKEVATTSDAVADYLR